MTFSVIYNANSLHSVLYHCFINTFVYFSEGRCLLELTHRSNTEGQEHWVPTTKKVYWPPPGPVKAESSPSVHSGKETTFYLLSRTSFLVYQFSFPHVFPTVYLLFRAILAQIPLCKHNGYFLGEKSSIWPIFTTLFSRAQTTHFLHHLQRNIRRIGQ